MNGSSAIWVSGFRGSVSSSRDEMESSVKEHGQP